MNITKKVDIPIMIVYTKNPNNNEESNQNSIKLLIRILTIIVITNINTYLIIIHQYCFITDSLNPKLKR